MTHKMNCIFAVVFFASLISCEKERPQPNGSGGTLVAQVKSGSRLKLNIARTTDGSTAPGMVMGLFDKELNVTCSPMAMLQGTARKALCVPTSLSFSNSGSQTFYTDAACSAAVSVTPDASKAAAPVFSFDFADAAQSQSFCNLSNAKWYRTKDVSPTDAPTTLYNRSAGKCVKSSVEFMGWFVTQMEPVDVSQFAIVNTKVLETTDNRAALLVMVSDDGLEAPLGIFDKKFDSVCSSSVLPGQIQKCVPQGETIGRLADPVYYSDNACQSLSNVVWASKCGKAPTYYVRQGAAQMCGAATRDVFKIAASHPAGDIFTKGGDKCVSYALDSIDASVVFDGIEVVDNSQLLDVSLPTAEPGVGAAHRMMNVNGMFFDVGTLVDQNTQTPCVPMLTDATQKEHRCIPQVNNLTLLSLKKREAFRDASCSQPLSILRGSESSCKAARFGLEKASESEIHVYELGGQVTTFFESDNGNCVPATSGATANFEIKREIPIGQFARMEVNLE